MSRSCLSDRTQTHLVRICHRAAHRCCGSWRAAGLLVLGARAWAAHHLRPPTQQAQQTAQRRRRCRRSARRQPVPPASPGCCTRRLAHLRMGCHWPPAAPPARLQPGQPHRLQPRPRRQSWARTQCRQTAVSRMACNVARTPARRATRPQHETTWSRCAFRHGLAWKLSPTAKRCALMCSNSNLPLMPCCSCFDGLL